MIITCHVSGGLLGSARCVSPRVSGGRSQRGMRLKSSQRLPLVAAAGSWLRCQLGLSAETPPRGLGSLAAWQLPSRLRADSILCSVLWVHCLSYMLSFSGKKTRTQRGEWMCLRSPGIQARKRTEPLPFPSQFTG